jgi:hypothetical protein
VTTIRDATKVYSEWSETISREVTTTTGDTRKEEDCEKQRSTEDATKGDHHTPTAMTMTGDATKGDSEKLESVSRDVTTDGDTTKADCDKIETLSPALTMTAGDSRITYDYSKCIPVSNDGIRGIYTGKQDKGIAVYEFDNSIPNFLRRTKKDRNKSLRPMRDTHVLCVLDVQSLSPWDTMARAMRIAINVYTNFQKLIGCTTRTTFLFLTGYLTKKKR